SRAATLQRLRRSSMKPTTRPHLAIACAALLAILAGCSSASDVRSDSGPSTTASSTTSAASSPDEKSATTTTEGVAASPADPKTLYIQGSVSIPEGEPGQLSVVSVGKPYGDFGSS